jgi:hypothetical protein
MDNRSGLNERHFALLQSLQYFEALASQLSELGTLGSDKYPRIFAARTTKAICEGSPVGPAIRAFETQLLPIPNRGWTLEYS